MTSIQSCGCPRRERPSVALFIAPPNSSLPLESDDKLSDQPAGPSKAKSLANALAVAFSVLKYSKDDLQQILKAVLEARAPIPIPAPTPTPVPAPVVSEVLWEKLKTRSLDVYCGKSYMDCYNFCQQCKNYFATARTIGPTQTSFAASFFQDRISFRWQQYKRRHDIETSVPVTQDEFKAFFCQSLGDS